MTVDMAVPPPPACESRRCRPFRHCEPERSEGEAIQKRRGHTVRHPRGIRGTARLDCFGGFAASQ
jgi:hypothetical protein